MDGMTAPGVGHNSETPPVFLLDVERLADDLALRYADLTARIAKHEAAHQRLDTMTAESVLSEDEAARVGDWVKLQLNPLIKDADLKRKFEKQPVRDAEAAVDAFFNRVGKIAEAAKQAALKALSDFTTEKDRLRREALQAEANRRADEAARLAARAEQRGDDALMNRAIATEQRAMATAEQVTTAKLADTTRTRGDYGSVISARRIFDFEVVEHDKVPHAYLVVNRQVIMAAIRSAPKDKAGTPQIMIPGIRITETTKAGVR
jgi:hypothetical protein